MSARRSSLFTTSALGALALAAVWGAPAHAQLVQGPTPAQSNGGAPTINQAGGNTTVMLGGSRTVIDWDRFDINSGERADFIFANRSDIVLNRVGGAAGSTINGDLNGMIGAGGPAGGNIWIYNANGVVIGANARINTGGLLVTTAALDRATDSSAGGFLDGSATSFNFSGAYDGGRIDVRTGAQIDTRGGALALVSPIINTETGSTLTASNGGNVLYGSAAGYKVSFRPTSTNDLDLLSFEVTSGAGGYGGTANLAGTTSGNRVFVSVVSQTGLVSQLVAPGAITATNVGTDETGAIVLTTNRNIVNGAVAASAVAGSGTGNLSAGDLTASAIDLVSSGYVLLNGSQNATGGSIRLIAETGNIHQNGPKITANTLSASAAGNIELGAGASGTPNSVAKLTSLTSTSGYISFAGDSYEIAGPITTPGAVGLSSTGLITGAGLITAGSLSFDAAGTINVNGNANLDYSNSRGNLTVNATGNIAMRNGWRLNGHALNLVSGTGSITQSGDAIYYGGTLNATAAGNIDFGGQTNQIDSFHGTSVAGDISVKSAGSLSFAVDTLGNATVDAGGAAIAGASIHAGTLGIRAGNYIDLNQSVLEVGSYSYLTSTGSGVSINTDSTINIGGNVSVASSANVSLRSNAGAINQTAGTITGRQLYLQAAGSITQNSAAQLVGTGTGANSVRAGDDLILAGSNRIAGFDTPILAWGAGNDVTYRSAYNMFFDGSSVAIGALNLIVDSGSIQQGSIAFTANSFSASATGDIDIGTAANNSIARLGNIGSSAGEVRLRVGTNNPLAIDGTISSASRVIFSARGAVSGSGKFATPGLYLDLIEGGTINVAGSTNLLQLGVSNADATVRADDSLTLSGALAANGRKLTLIAGTGSITQTGGSFIGTGTLSATAAGDISLTAANSFSGVDATSTGGGRITLNATGALLVGLNTTGSAAVTAGGNLSSNGITVDSLSVEAGHIDLTAGVDVNSFTRLVAAYGDILVTNNGGFAVAGDITTNRPGLRTIDLQANGGGISQTAGTISGHYVRLRGAGDLIQSGTGRIDSNAADFSGANVLLGGANNLISNDTRIVATGNLTLRNAGSIDLTVIGGYTAGGVLTLTSDTGSITSTDAISATALTAHAANGAVTFNHANNLFAEIRGLSAATNATIVSRYGGFALHGDADVGGTLSLRAGQWINQTAGRIKATTLDAQLYQTMTTGSVLLGGANDVDNLYVLAASGGGDVLFRDTDGFRVTYAVIGNRVTLTSDAGAITQASGFMDGVQASQLTVSAVDGISLNNDWNGIRTILGFTNSGTGGIDIASRGVNMVLAGNVTAAGQTVNLAVQNASLSQTGGAIIARRLDAAARTGITLTQAGNNISQLGTLSNSASGGIAYTDSNGYSIVGNITAAGQSLTLGSRDSTVDIYQANSGSMITAGTLNINGGRYYSLRGVNGTGNAIGAIGNINVKLGLNTIGAVDFRGDVITDYIELLAGGDITQSSGRIENQGGQLAFWGTNISLTSATNRLGNILQLRTWDNGPTGWFNVGTGNITLVSAGDVAVGYVSAVNASLTSGGNIGTISSGLAGNVNVERLSIASGGTVSLAGAIRALGNVSATGETFLNSWTDLALTGTINTGTGALALQSGGSISQTGGSITAGVIDVSAATGIDLGRTNTIATISSLSTTNGDISFRNWGSIALPAINAPGTLTLISDSGSVTQNSGTTLRANRLNASAGTLIDLTNANQLASLGTLIAGTTVSVTNHGSLSLTGDILANSVTLRSTFGAISQTGGVISALDLTASAQNGLNFGSANTVGALHGLSTTFGDIAFRNQGNIVLSDVSALTGAVTLTSDGGSITQNASTTIMAERVNASAATGITLDQDNGFVRTGTLSNSGTGGIRVKTAGNLDLAGTVTATGQAVRFDVDGALTQSAALGAYSSLTVNAGTGIYLDQANNFGATTFSFSNGAGDITVRNVGNLTLPAITTSGTIRLISDTGTIGQTGIFTANTLIAEARREIALGRNNVVTNVGGLVNTTGTITFRDADGFNITGDIRGSISTGERLILSAGGTGDIVQTGGSIVADKLRVTVGGNLTLDGSANTFMNVEVLSVGGDVRLRAQDGFVVGYTLEAGGTMTLTSTNGFIGTELGSIGHVRADALYVNAATGIDINLPGNITPKASLITAAGNIRYTSQGAMELLALRTPDRAIISANALTQSGAIDIGSLDALAGDIRLDVAGNRIGSIHAAMATGGDVVITDEDGIDIAGNLDASGTISLTAGGTGSITQSGGIITAPTVSLVAAGGNITLDRANAAGVYNARSVNGGTIMLRNAGNLTVDAITAQNGTVNLTSDTGSVGQLLVPNNSIWAGKLNASAATDIELAAQNITGLLGNLTAGGSIRYNSFGTLGLDGDIRSVGGVTFGIQGFLGQYSGTVTASHLDVTASGIALIGANDIGSTTASRFSASDDITFRSVNSILLGATSTPGLLSLTSDNGGIAQTAAFSAGRFDASAAGDIVLEQLNTLGTIEGVTAGDVFSLRTVGALELDGHITASDRVTLNTGGGLTQIGNTVIASDRLEATATGGIRLLNHNRVGAISLEAGGNDIRFRNTGNIAINAINSPTGTVELISNLGQITQQAGGGLIVGSLVLNAGNGVALYNTDNQIARLDVISRGNVSIHTGASGYGGVLTIDRIDAAGQVVSLNNGSAGTTGGNITAATLNIFSAGNLDLGTTNNVTGEVSLSGWNTAFTNRGNLVIAKLMTSSGDAVLRSEEGAISQTGSATISINGLTAYGRDGVTLAGWIKRIDGLSAGAGADVEIVSDLALELAGDITARNVLLRSNASPDPFFNPTGGSITQTGGIITADLFRGSAYGAIDLRLGNQIAALGDVWSFTSGISITSDRALDLTGALTATAGDVVLDAASIGQSGGSIEALGLGVRADGAIDLGAVNRIASTGTVTLDAGGDIAFRNDGGFILGMIDTPGVATFSSTNGSIGQAAATRIGAVRLSVSAANGGINLNEANLVDTLGGLTAGGAVVFRNTGDLALDGDIAATGQEVTLRSNTGAVSQTSGTITALGLTVKANGAIALGGANHVTNLRDMSAGGNLLYRNAGALMLWGDVTGDEVTLSTDSGSLLQMLFTGGVITANRLNASAGGALNFNHANRVVALGDYASGSGVAGFTNDGDISLVGNVSGDEVVLQSLTGGITQTAGSLDAGSIQASAAGPILLNQANQVAAAGPVRLVSTGGDVTFRALGGFTLDFGTAAGIFDVTSDTGSIGQTGLITVNRLNARAGGDIALTGDNAVAGLGTLSAAGDIVFTAAGDLLLTDAIDANGTVSLVANNGVITQSGGAITAAALDVSANGSIALARANTVSAFAGTSTAGNITLRNTGGISLGAVTAGGGFGLTLDAGAVTQTGDLRTAGGLAITARDGITLTRSGNANQGPLSLTNLGTGGIAYTDSGAMWITSIGAAGQTVTLNAGGAVTQTGGIDAALLNLTTPGNVLLTNAMGNRIGALGIVDVRQLSLTIAGNLDLTGAIAASDALTLTVNGRLTQSGGLITTPSLSIAASHGIDLGGINQVDALTATNSGGSGDVRFVNGRSLSINSLGSDHGDLTLRLTAGDLTLNGAISSFGNLDIDVAGNVASTGGIDSQKSVRVKSGASIDLASVAGRDDILIDATADAKVAELLHLTGGTDSAGDGYNVDILGNNATLGAISRASLTGTDRLYVETGATVRLGARAGNATLNLATMNHGVSIAATGDVSAYGADGLNLVNVSGENVSLSAATGGIGADRVDVAGNYTLDGPAFYRNVLQPLGARAGSWTLTSTGDVDAAGRTLEYGGDIAVTAVGTVWNGSVRSLDGAVSISAGVLDLNQISAATGISVDTVGALNLFSADTFAGGLGLTGGSVIVGGNLDAAGDITVAAVNGDAVIGYAIGARNISVSAAGNATLRQANLNGATGDLIISAGGNATLGEDDAMSGIGTDRWFARAAGSTGSATVTGGAGVSINLDRSAKLDSISGRRVEVNIATGDLAIGQLTALTERGIVSVLRGSLVIGSAAATGSALDLSADGDLTLLSTANGFETYLTAGGLLDTRTATLNGANYVELTGGEVRAGAITSGGDIDALSTRGAISADSVHSTGGDAIFHAYTDLNLASVTVKGGQLQAGGNATLRAITATDGFALLALGDITLGADTAGQITGGNLLSTGGSLSGCACGSGGATLISLNGSVNVHLQSATGVFDTIAAGINGDANVHVATGDLGIGDLAGHNIAVMLPGGTLTVMNPVSSGGNYTLTARDFAGNALLPIVGGSATRLNNVTITDTDGDLAAGGTLVAAGDIRVSSVGNITGGLTLLADGDVDVSARAIRLGDIAGRNVVLNASAGSVDVGGAVTVGRNYTLTGTGFFGNALAMTGARAGNLLVTDTAGDFDYTTLDLSFAGSATLRATGGAIRGGDIGTLGNLNLSASGVLAGLLRSAQGGVDVESSAGADLNGVQASNAIRVSAGGDLRLGRAELSGTGVNAFTLAARGDLVFGASSAGAIGSGHIFTSAGSAMTGGGVQADGAIAINLGRSAELARIEGGTLELTVRNGDLTIGDIRTVGALFVSGPAGVLTVGDVETSAGHIGISGQGNVTTGAVNGRFVIHIGSSAGSLTFGRITGGEVTLGAAGGVTATGVDAGIFASSLALTAGGNVDLATHGTGSRIGRLGAVTVANGGLILNNLQDLDLSGAIDVSGTLDLRVAGALNQSGGSVTAQRLVGSVSGLARLDGPNRVSSLGDFSTAGLLLNNATALGIEGVVDGGAGSVTIRARGGMTIGAAGAVHSAAAGDAITLASDGLFRNLAGGSALSATNGRWLVYTQATGNAGASDPANDFGGLAGRSFYGAAYDFATGSFGAAPNAGNRFVYGYRPVLTVLPNNIIVTYDGQVPVPGASMTGLVNGDRAADAWSGAASLSGAGRNAGTYNIVASLGTLASDMNYDFAFGTGTLRIDPRTITATLAANGKIYDGTAAATGTLSLGGVIAGDDVGVSGSLAFGDKNAGIGKTVTASGIALSGADAGNYTVNLTATGLADILARTITATLTANGKTYDGTAAATGALSLNGVVAGDDIGATGMLAFGDKNAGTGKTVTASGIALSGADARNYVVNASTTALADILARAITATLTANGKVYDGTTAATGALSLGGVLAGDTLIASGSYAFGDKNAGSGKTVTANGIALSGADAGNYTVNASATALADILARTIAATLTANGKTYDGTTAATGNLSLDGVIAGDTVGVSGSLDFADKNAAAGKTVTATGIALNGADASNYIVNTTAIAFADILARAITATLTASGKTYDATTAATGTLSLGGVLAGDQVAASGSYAFADKNAGTGKTVTASGITLSGADAGNYVVNASTTALADILARAITATLTANGKVYDGTATATGALSLGGVLAGDAVSASGSYAFGDKNAGTGKTVTASGIALSGADAGNYSVNGTATGLADILARTITATLAANGKVYDGTTAAVGTLSLGGMITGDEVGATGTLAFADRNAGTRKIVTANGIALSGADAGNYIVNTSATALADILARTITATLMANGKVYDGTTAATGALSLGGVIAGDDVGVSGSLAFADKNAGAGKTVTASGITLSGADAANYIVNGAATDVATIARLAITGTATADSRVYDGTIAAAGRITLNGVLIGDNVSASAAYAFTDRNAGTARTVSVNGLTLNGADAGNYTVTLGGGAVLADILRRAMIVQADDVTKLFGQRDPGFTWRVIGGSLVPGDGFTGELARAPGEQAGTYAIDRGSLALSPNYSLTVVPGSLVIRFTQSGADSSDALHRRRPTGAFSLYEDPSVNLVGDAQGE
jgi:filamentous hemagglutinin family protein